MSQGLAALAAAAALCGAGLLYLASPINSGDLAIFPDSGPDGRDLG